MNQNMYTPKIIDLFGLKWVTKQKWNNWQTNEFDGMYHQDFPQMYYDESAVEVNNGELRLITHENPKLVNGIQIPYGCGLVSTVDNFRFGIFSVEIMLPKTPYVWPAFWTMSPLSWPPEIDIMEAWSGKNGLYSKWPAWLPFVRRKVTTNFHYGISRNGEHLSTGSQLQRIVNPTGRFVNYELYWAKDLIQIRFDGRLVHEITDSEVLKWFDVDMWFILNNVIDLNGYDGDYSVMRCKNFKYTKIN